MLLHACEHVLPPSFTSQTSRASDLCSSKTRYEPHPALTGVTMDPLSALGAAAAVTQFVDYSIIILKDTREIIKSVNGRTAKHIELSLISTDLKRLIEEVDTKSSSLATNETQPSEDVFLRLCGECREIADQLLASCARLQATGVTRLDTVASSFVVAVRGVWRSGKLEDLRQRLDQVRQQMMMAVLTYLWCATAPSPSTHIPSPQENKSIWPEISADERQGGMGVIVLHNTVLTRTRSLGELQESKR